MEARRTNAKLAAESQPTDFSPTMSMTAAKRPPARRRSIHQAAARQATAKTPKAHALFANTVNFVFG